MKIKGVVSSVDENLLIVGLGNKEEVCFTKFLSEYPLSNLPKLGEIVTIQRAYYTDKGKFFLDESSYVEEYESVPYNDSLVKIHDKYKLTLTDLVELYKVIDFIKSHFNLTQVTLFEVVENILEVFRLSEEDSLISKQILPRIDLVSLCFCCFIGKTTRVYPKFPYWTYGVHGNTNDTYLIGELKIDGESGRLLFSDQHYKKIAYIYNLPEGVMSKLVNQMVIIKEYHIVTEFYNELCVENAEVIFTDFRKIHIITKNCDYSSGMYFDSKLQCDVLPRQFGKLIYVHRKSSVTLNDSFSKEFWLEVEERNHIRYFLILPEKYLKVYIFLQAGNCYELFCKRPLSEERNSKLGQFDFSRKRYKVVEAIFIKSSEHISFSKDVKYHSVTGVVVERTFGTAYTSGGKKVDGFGTLGSNDHSIKIRDNEKEFAIFLTKWNAFQTPLSLVPGAVIKITDLWKNDVKVWYRNTYFTNIEIIGFQPEFQMDTANLALLSLPLEQIDKVDWGKEAYLSLGANVPKQVLVYGKPLWFRVEKLLIQLRSLINGDPMTDPPDQVYIEFVCRIVVYDEFGKSKVEIKTMKFLKLLLDVSENKLKSLLESFRKTGFFMFNSFGYDKGIIKKYSEFDQYLSNFLTNYNQLKKIRLGLICRKWSCEGRNSESLPQWDCICFKKM